MPLGEGESEYFRALREVWGCAHRGGRRALRLPGGGGAAVHKKARTASARFRAAHNDHKILE